MSDETEVLSDYVLQFGAFHGQTFRWILANGLGYAAWLVDNMWNETVTAAPLSQNKASFKAYAMAFEESRQAIDKKRVEREAKEKPTVCASTTSARPSRVIASSLVPLVLGRTSTKDLSIKFSRTLGKSATRFRQT